jgi:hypothetical protein
VDSPNANGLLKAILHQNGAIWQASQGFPEKTLGWTTEPRRDPHRSKHCSSCGRLDWGRIQCRRCKDSVCPWCGDGRAEVYEGCGGLRLARKLPAKPAAYGLLCAIPKCAIGDRAYGARRSESQVLKYPSVDRL